MDSTDWFRFHMALSGFQLTKRGKPIEKFIVFWTGYKLENILEGNSIIKIAK